MKTTTKCGATLIDCMGDDRTVVNAARVSFAKEVEAMSDADERLIAYLAKHAHWSPFAHPHLSFRVSAPLFVARQLGKHQVGLAWNEESRRYVSDEPTFYVPTEWRAKADNVKQGSSDEVLTVIRGGDKAWKDMGIDGAYGELCDIAYGLYQSLIGTGVCPEQARMVLPQSMMVNWIWTGSLYAFARVVNQRLDSHAQRECRPIALDIAAAMRDRFPVSAKALLAQ